MPDDPLVQLIFEVDELGHFTFQQAADLYTCPLADDFGNVFRVDLFLQHAVTELQLVEVLGGFGDAPFELGDAPVANLGRHRQVGLTLDLGAQLLELFLQRANCINGLLLVLPVGLHAMDLHVERGQLVDDDLQPFLGSVVRLLGERDLFDLELQDAALYNVDLRG